MRGVGGAVVGLAIEKEEENLGDVLAKKLERLRGTEEKTETKCK